MAKKDKDKEKIQKPAEDDAPDKTAEETELVSEEAAVEETAEEVLLRQLADTNDRLLRLAAEYDNYRKRTSKEKEELYAMSKLSVITEFLPVIDNLDRALSNKADRLDDYKKGVEMIGKQFYETLKKLGAEEFGEPGDVFDPELHNAVMHIEDEGLGDNVVSAVFSKGYRLGSKVIRHAMVQVAN